MSTSDPIAQVVPAIPTFAVDDGFSYSIPEGLEVSVGSIVRIPVGNRRKRGYVTSLRTGSSKGLKPIASVSGDFPAFDEGSLEVIKWVATHYVAPMSVVLAKTAPPNLPKRVRLSALDEPARAPASPAPLVSEQAAAGKKAPAVAVLVPADYPAAIAGLIKASIEADRSALVVAPTIVEATAIAESLQAWFGNRVVVSHSSLDSKERTKAWVRARTQPGVVVVGTREVALWPVTKLAMAVAVEEERPAMKDPQTPTVHVRELLRKRSSVERFSLAFVGPTASTDLVAAGVNVIKNTPRTWPLVEVVDRSIEPPEGRLISSLVVQAMKIAHERGKRIFVFAHRRGYAPAFRCVKCRALRSCPECQSRWGRGSSCDRCGFQTDACTECGAKRFEPLGAGVERVSEEVHRALGLEKSSPLVAVGTEADLAGSPAVDIAVVVDGDGLMAAPHYRSRERALQVMVRVARLVERGRGNRLIVQTNHPSDPVIAALRRGDSADFITHEFRERYRLALPPAGEVIVIETSAPAQGLEELAAERRAEVFGPAPAGKRFRWLIQGGDLHGLRIGLRALVHEWRQAGIKVRVDADPREM